jgi:hypothetical protein
MRSGVLFGIILLIGFPPAHSVLAETSPPPAYIALIIDDLGNNRTTDEQATRLPGPVACAILPHTSNAVEVANLAHQRNKEVLLHLPMEATGGETSGPGTLDSTMFKAEIGEMLDYDLASVPHVVGINNHMGSQLTADAPAMEQLMRRIHRHTGLFFVDSRTNPASVAQATALQTGIPATGRDVFLDNDPTPAAIEKQLKTLIRIARRRGYALGIGHPHPATLAVLEQWLPQLAHQGIQVISVGNMLDLQKKEHSPWQASSSP